jgi:chemotaxis response regulator CheB
VVDDSVFARKNLARIVETFGGQVAGEAGDGMTAITEYDRTNPDIVLMDITMPQMEGIEAAEKIVAQHPEARIVMVSSVGYQENICGGAAARGPSLCAEAGETGSSVRSHQVRARAKTALWPMLLVREPDL